MAMTREERDKITQDRKNRRREAKLKFPGAYLWSAGCQLELEVGVTSAIKVKVETADSGWATGYVPVTDPCALLELIVALSAIYNARVSELNVMASACSLVPLHTIPRNEPPDCPQHPAGGNA